MTPTEETTLEEELALGLDKYVEQLQAISAQASKEYALEKVPLFIYFYIKSESIKYALYKILNSKTHFFCKKIY